LLTSFPIHANVAAVDVDRAKAWYADKLGLTPDIVGEEGVWYRFADGTWLHVYQTAFAGTAKNTVAGWSVTDLESVVEGLRARGVQFEDYDLGEGYRTVNGIMDAGGAKAAWFIDSEGNTFELSEASPGD
jgi:catechol 2,3-dioxygenase-like lactoylglutathione lyase family enzyme